MLRNEYRVDRVDEERVPCGMNSIIYAGSSEVIARKEFRIAKLCIDTWGQYNDNYGVILSKWNRIRHDYYIIDKRFPCKLEG